MVGYLRTFAKKTRKLSSPGFQPVPAGASERRPPPAGPHPHSASALQQRSCQGQPLGWRQLLLSRLRWLTVQPTRGGATKIKYDDGVKTWARPAHAGGGGGHFGQTYRPAWDSGSSGRQPLSGNESPRFLARRGASSSGCHSPLTSTHRRPSIHTSAPPVDDDTPRLPEPSPLDSGQARRAWKNGGLLPFLSGMNE